MQRVQIPISTGNNAHLTATPFDVLCSHILDNRHMLHKLLH